MKKQKAPVRRSMSREITNLLIPALESLKSSLGEKKFEKRIKKAAKLLARGIKQAPAKKKKAVKKTAKKRIAKSSRGKSK